MELQLSNLHRHFDRLQQQYGCPDLDSIYGAGCIDKPDLCLIFMNPTSRNIAADRHWKGLKAPWLGTKNSWKLFQGIGILSQQTLAEIQSKKPADWDEDFAEKIYREIAANKAYVTNLGKCTQSDASPVSNTVFKQYLTLLEQEIDQIRPQTVITFGNQVSSLFLNQPVCVSQQRRTAIKRQSTTAVTTFFRYFIRSDRECGIWAPQSRISALSLKNGAETTQHENSFYRRQQF